MSLTICDSCMLSAVKLVNNRAVVLYKAVRSLQLTSSSEITYSVKEVVLLLQERVMRILSLGFVLALSSLTVVSSSFQYGASTCPSDDFPVTFLSIIEQVVDAPSELLVDDPELEFFTEVLKYRDPAIKLTIELAIQFFNETYGLDFSQSEPDDENKRFFENAIMCPFVMSEEADQVVPSNSWIRTGNTRSTCYEFRLGGFKVVFSGEQTLHGSYGGVEGLPARHSEILYGVNQINSCEQSPILIQYQSNIPIRTEPFDDSYIFSFDVYNAVLGYGEAHGIGRKGTDPDEPNLFRVVLVFTFSL